MDLSLNTRQVGRAVVVGVAGEVDVSTSPKLRDELVAAVGESTEGLVIDLQGVEFIDSTGLGVLVGILKRVRSKRGRLALVIGDNGVRRVFTITGLEKVFAIHGALADALADVD